MTAKTKNRRSRIQNKPTPPVPKRTQEGVASDYPSTSEYLSSSEIGNRIYEELDNVEKSETKLNYTFLVPRSSTPTNAETGSDSGLESSNNATYSSTITKNKTSFFTRIIPKKLKKKEIQFITLNTQS